MTRGLTQRQQDVLSSIGAHLEQNGYPPSRREIAAAVGVRVRVADEHVRRLAKKGYIEVASFLSRGLRVLEPGRLALGLTTTPSARVVDVLSPTRCHCGCVRFGAHLACPICKAHR